MKRASYRDAVRWIALNDEAGNDDGEAAIAEYVTVALIADVFAVERERVAKDVMRVRQREG